MGVEGFGALISYNEALKILKENTPSFSRTEEVELKDGLMRVTAEDVHSPIDVPHFARAAMDGYAVKSSDTFGATYQNPVRLKSIGSIKPGDLPDVKILSGTCVRISTGGAMPTGADSVIMLEDTELFGDEVLCHKPIAPQTNVVTIGSDFKRDDVIVKARTLLMPPQLGALAAVGISKVEVISRPKVAVLSTGAEIIEKNEKLVIGKVFNINGETLSAALRSFGCEPQNFGIVPDEEASLESALKKALDTSDMVLISGGSSLGEGDIVPHLFGKLGKLLFHGIAVKPGKPTAAALIGDKLVIGLPGYPTSALSNFYILIVPVLERIFGVSFKLRSQRAKLARKVTSTIGRYEFLPVKLDGEFAHPLIRGSSAISSLSLADGFVEIPENVEVLPQGTDVNVRLF